MSNLPLMPGDDIAIFILAPNYPHEKDGMTCYPTDRYIPIGFPIFAEYDDDTQVRNVREINEYMTRYLHEFATLYTRRRKTDQHNKEYFEFQKYSWTNIEDFLYDAIHGALYVASRTANDSKHKLEYVMMHTDLYFALINNIANRIPYGETENYEKLMYSRVLKAIEWMKEDDDLQLRLKQKYGPDAPSLKRFSDKIHIDSFSRWQSLNHMANYYMETYDGIILDEIVNYILWSVVMNYSRKGYHCYSGGGSQCQEMMLQKIIAEFIIKKCNEREREALDDASEYGNDISSNPLEEPLYF
jgi:hypothetical protein